MGTSLVQIINYSPDEVFLSSELDKSNLEYADSDNLRTWIDIENFTDSVSYKQLDQLLDLHPLLKEDIENVQDLPKLEDNDDFIFICLKDCQIKNDEPVYFQKTLIVGDDYLISFHSANEGGSYKEIFDRIKHNKGRVRKKGIDYLFYLLLDTLIDRYYPIVDYFKANILEVENELLENSGKNQIHLILDLRRELVEFRKFLSPLKEIIMRLRKEQMEFVQEENQIYYNDIEDHINYLISTADSLREMMSGLITLNESNLNISMNQVMKTLTIIATLFIPLTFIVGIYGMNFDYMPELHYKWSYPIVWGVMILITVGLIIYFRVKRWI